MARRSNGRGGGESPKKAPRWFPSVHRIVETFLSAQECLTLHPVDAYFRLCNRMRERLLREMPGPSTGTFRDDQWALEVGRKMIPVFEQVQAVLWDRKQKGEGGAIEMAVDPADYCEGCRHHRVIHGGGACAYFDCKCQAFAGPPDFKEQMVAAAVQIAAEARADGPGWDGG